MQLKPGQEEETHPDNSPVCTPLRKVFHPD